MNKDNIVFQILDLKSNFNDNETKLPFFDGLNLEATENQIVNLVDKRFKENIKIFGNKFINNSKTGIFFINKKLNKNSRNKKNTLINQNIATYSEDFLKNIYYVFNPKEAKQPKNINLLNIFSSYLSKESFVDIINDKIVSLLTNNIDADKEFIFKKYMELHLITIKEINTFLSQRMASILEITKNIDFKKLLIEKEKILKLNQFVLETKIKYNDLTDKSFFILLNGLVEQAENDDNFTDFDKYYDDKKKTMSKDIKNARKLSASSLSLFQNITKLENELSNMKINNKKFLINNSQTIKKVNHILKIKFNEDRADALNQNNNIVKYLYFKKAFFWKQLLKEFKRSKSLKKIIWLKPDDLNKLINDVFFHYQELFKNISDSDFLSKKISFKYISEISNKYVFSFKGYLDLAKNEKQKYNDEINDLKKEISTNKKHLNIIKGKVGDMNEQSFLKQKKQINKFFIDLRWDKKANLTSNKIVKYRLKQLFEKLNKQLIGNNQIFNNFCKKLDIFNTKLLAAIKFNPNANNIECFNKIKEFISLNKLFKNSFESSQKNIKVLFTFLLIMNKKTNDFKNTTKNLVILHFIKKSFTDMSIPFWLVHFNNLNYWNEEYFKSILLAFLLITNKQIIYISSMFLNNVLNKFADFKMSLKQKIIDKKMILLFISEHPMYGSNFSDFTYISYYGQIIEQGITKSIINNPVHPHTRKLITNYYNQKNKMNFIEIKSRKSFDPSFHFNLNNIYDQPKILPADIYDNNHVIYASFEQFTNWNKKENEKLLTTITFQNYTDIEGSDYFKLANKYEIAEKTLFDLSYKLKIINQIKTDLNYISYNFKNKSSQYIMGISIYNKINNNYGAKIKEIIEYGVK